MFPHELEHALNTTTTGQLHAYAMTPPTMDAQTTTPEILDNGLDLLANDTSSIAHSGVGNATYDGYDYYYYGEEYFYEENEPYVLESFLWEEIPLGYVRPALVFLTFITNVFVVGFFLTRNIRGRATNLLFVSIAFSDTMTGILLLPNSFYVYAGLRDELTRDWCNVYMMTKLYFSNVFHTLSIWQTVVLGIQRYMCVCHPFISGRICTTGKTFASIVIMYVLAFVLHVYHVVNDKVMEHPNRCAWQPETPCSGTCVYLWFSVALQHVMPCLILVCLTIVTLIELRKANRRVSSMSHRSAQKRSSRDRIITITTTLVVIVFLVPELPHGVCKTVLAIHVHKNIGLVDNTEINHLILTIYEILLLITFNANFWIYCSMMHDFRHALFKLVTCGVFKRGLARVRTYSGSASSRKNSVNTTVSRTSSVVSRNRILSQTTSIHSAASDTLHAVIPMSPTRVWTQEFHRGESMEDQNDDVFV